MTEIRIGVAELLREIDAAEKHYADTVKARTRADLDAGFAWRHLCALEERLQKEHGLRRVSKENPT